MRRFRQATFRGSPVPDDPMILWTLRGLPGMDGDADRVARWFQQWPEALAHEARATVHEIVRGTGLGYDDVNAALMRLEAIGFYTTCEVEADGSFWFLLTLMPRRDVGLPTGGPPAPTPEPSKVPREERRTIPLSLRWFVLVRDGHKCQSCGATTSDGAVLHIDHIKPYSKGGLTVLDNLQALCRDCNAGKRDRWAEPEGGP